MVEMVPGDRAWCQSTEHPSRRASIEASQQNSELTEKTTVIDLLPNPRVVQHIVIIHPPGNNAGLEQPRRVTLDV